MFDAISNTHMWTRIIQMFEQITECADDFVEAVEKEANTRKALDFKE